MTAPTPATQTTLADWLEVQFAADEAEARRILAVGSCEPAYRPARVLADVAARRAVLALHEPQDAHWAFSSRHSHHTPTCTECVSFHADMDCENEPWPCPTLRHLASVYSDHPGYDERWAVS